MIHRELQLAIWVLPRTAQRRTATQGGWSCAHELLCLLRVAEGPCLRCSLTRPLNCVLSYSHPCPWAHVPAVACWLPRRFLCLYLPKHVSAWSMLCAGVDAAVRSAGASRSMPADLCARVQGSLAGMRTPCQANSLLKDCLFLCTCLLMFMQPYALER